MPDRKRGAAAERRTLDGRYWTGLTAGIPDPRPRQLRDVQQSCANQSADISLIDRRLRGPRRVPYLALGICNSPTKCAGQDNLAFVDNESHINVRLQARAACGASSCEPLFGGTRS